MRQLFQLLILVVFLTGCGSNPKEEIVGVWKDADQSKVQFFEGGTTTAYSPQSEKSATGTYEWVDNDHIKVTWQSGPRTDVTVSEIHIKENKMTLKALGARDVVTFERVE